MPNRQEDDTPDHVSELRNRITTGGPHPTQLSASQYLHSGLPSDTFDQPFHDLTVSRTYFACSPITKSLHPLLSRLFWPPRPTSQQAASSEPFLARLASAYVSLCPGLGFPVTSTYSPLLEQHRLLYGQRRRGCRLAPQHDIRALIRHPKPRISRVFPSFDLRRCTNGALCCACLTIGPGRSIADLILQLWQALLASKAAGRKLTVHAQYLDEPRLNLPFVQTLTGACRTSARQDGVSTPIRRHSLPRRSLCHFSPPPAPERPSTSVGTDVNGDAKLAVDRTPSPLHQGLLGTVWRGESLQRFTKFDAAYYTDNMTILFHIDGTTNLKSENLVCKGPHTLPTSRGPRLTCSSAHVC